MKFVIVHTQKLGDTTAPAVDTAETFDLAKMKALQMLASDYAAGDAVAASYVSILGEHGNVLWTDKCH